MKRNIYRFLALGFTVLSLSACGDSFLDEMPDNRTQVDTEDKVKALLVSAYPDHDFNMITELSSDNVDDTRTTYTDRYPESLYFWRDVTESDNESPEQFWQESYMCIAVANQALESLDEIAEEKGEWTMTMLNLRSEALLCRAYNHFMLLNVFAQHYNSATADKEPGITIMTKPETTLQPKYDRSSVKKCYEFIKKDLEEALPYVSDAHLKVPKYHFNPSAAYAFATRFYLYYEMPEKAIECANHVLGANPKTMLRDYSVMGAMTQTSAAVSQHYVDPNLNCNLLITTGYSKMGRVFLNYSTWKRFTHSYYLSMTETAEATQAWGKATYYSPIKSYTGNNYYKIFWRMPDLVEYTDPVAGTGYRHSAFVNFTTDEVLLNRAEAYILTKQYDDACTDINLWLNNIASTTTKGNVTRESVTEFFNSIAYGTAMESTPKKHLHPAFQIEAEGSEQESMLQCVLNARRIEQLHTGMRWFDVKRYGIEIWRREVDGGGDPIREVDVLKVNDPRRAIQIPYKVISAGYDANPRDKGVNQLDYVIKDEEMDKEAVADEMETDKN